MITVCVVVLGGSLLMGNRGFQVGLCQYFEEWVMPYHTTAVWVLWCLWRQRRGGGGKGGKGEGEMMRNGRRKLEEGVRRR